MEGARVSTEKRGIEQGNGGCGKKKRFKQKERERQGMTWAPVTEGCQVRPWNLLGVKKRSLKDIRKNGVLVPKGDR